MSFLSQTSVSAEDSKQYYEVRTYVIGDNGDKAAVDKYLGDALVPALGRQNIGPIGVFEPSENDENKSERLIVVIPLTSADQLPAIHAALANDADYQAAAKSYLDRGPKESPYQRITSELLIGMDCMPQLTVPAGTLDNKDRVYELRLYESPNERLGNLKVDMFNSGEVPIFLDCKIQPIFIGQCVVGPQTPSLTYLTVYANEEARNQAWVDFRKHPDWKVLSKVAKYAGTVSHIDKHVLVPRPYSQM
ncbi:NIPSNAP family protein [Stieleria varia]|nr:NIPSNAP family protein [Stieleria varia]